MEIEAALKIFNRIAAVGLGLIAVRFGHVAPFYLLSQRLP